MFMRVLLIAYEYPPIVAAQSLRWFYLANEMARSGVEVEILTISLHDRLGFQGRIHERILMHRCFPGPFIGCANWFLGKGVSSDLSNPSGIRQSHPTDQSDFLLRSYGFIRGVLNQVLFPDVRSEWFPFAWKTLKRLFKRKQYDVLISSHEPGVGLLLGLATKQKFDIPWVIDLADPLLAPYTPTWRRWLDLRAERIVCRHVDHILVTNTGVVDLLRSRHRIPLNKFTVITQGFDAYQRWFPIELSENYKGKRVLPERNGFTLVYTGTFYRDFRNPTELFNAIREVPSVHLILAGSTEGFEKEIHELGDQVTALGKVNHEDCLYLQRRATVLVNIGNKQDFQVPGKLYEFIGAGRPILHIASAPGDPSAVILKRFRRGTTAQNDRQEIASTLTYLVQLWEIGTLDTMFDLSPEGVNQFSWEAAAKRVIEVCDGVKTLSRH